MLDAILTIAEEFSLYIENGGIVMWPLVLGTIALWFSIAYRFVVLKRGSDLPLRLMISRLGKNPADPATGFVDTAVNTAWRIFRQGRGDIDRQLDDAFFPLKEGMGRFRDLVRTIVIIAPLAGLLGTVTGMIEMFDSLGNQTFYSQTGGIANGISQALFTTQFGLCVAVPGMIIGRLLDRKEDRMQEELFQIREFFNSLGESGEQAV